MILITTAFPRSGNTFLTHLLTNCCNLEQKKLPKDFTSLDDLYLFCEQHLKTTSNRFILSHNHMYKLQEFKLGLKYDVPSIYVFRDPVGAIASFNKFRSRKDSTLDSFSTSYAQVLHDIVSYSTITGSYVLLKLMRRRVLAVQFKNLTQSPKDNIERVIDFLDMDCTYSQEFETEYLNSTFQQNTKLDVRDRSQHLNKLQKALIFCLCGPLYGLQKILG